MSQYMYIILYILLYRQYLYSVQCIYMYMVVNHRLSEVRIILSDLHSRLVDIRKDKEKQEIHLEERYTVHCII